MVIQAHHAAVARLNASGNHPDVAAIVAQHAGFTDTAGVNAMVQGLADISHWLGDDLLWFADARDGRNAGSGATVYTYVGDVAGTSTLAAGSGTSVNGPSFGPTGLTYTAASNMRTDFGFAQNLNDTTGFTLITYMDRLTYLNNSRHHAIDGGFTASRMECFESGSWVSAKIDLASDFLTQHSYTGFPAGFFTQATKLQSGAGRTRIDGGSYVIDSSFTSPWSKTIARLCWGGRLAYPIEANTVIAAQGLWSGFLSNGDISTIEALIAA